jgi:hypothetical protein
MISLHGALVKVTSPKNSMYMKKSLKTKILWRGAKIVALENN